MIRTPERKPPLYLITGLVFGLLLGLVLAWLVWPVRVSSVGPSSLSVEDKEQYRLMVALAYAASGDMGRAQARLNLLGDADPVRALTSQAQTALANSATQREARALAGLAAELGSMLSSQQATLEAVNTPGSAEVGSPVDTAGEGARYSLDSQQLICGAASDAPEVRVYLFNAQNLPEAGVRMQLQSSEDQAELTTGNHPSEGPGYAEAEITPGEVYTLSIQDTEMMGAIQAAACQTAEGEPAWGSWQLIFHAIP